MAFEIGQIVQATSTFTVLGEATDPGTVTLEVRAPTQTISTFTSYVYGTDVVVVRDGTGVYHVDIPLNDDGLWYARWVSTGTAATAKQFSWTVDPSQFVV